MNKRVAVFLLASAAAVAQTRPARKPAPASDTGTPGGWPIQSIQVRGNQNFTPQQIITASGLYVGENIGKPQLDAAQQRLLATGNFETVGYEYRPARDSEGYAVTLEIAELGQFVPVRFENLPVSDTEIREYLLRKDPLFGPRISPAKQSVDHYTKLLSDFLASRNYHEAVTASVTAEDSPDLVILFRPAAERPNVAEVQFLNTGEISNGTLKTAFYGVAVGTTYTETHFRKLLDLNVRPLYEARGHLQVTFPKLTIEPAKDVKGVVVTVQVEPGPVFKFGKTGFAGTAATRGLNDLIKLKTGELANFDEVRAAQARITEDFRRKGYLQTKTDVARDIHGADRTADVTFRVTTGPQFLFGKLNIEGLDIITEPVIRKMWSLREGKPFQPDYPDRFLKEIREEGIFDNLKSALSNNELNAANHTVDVTLYFNKPGATPQPDAHAAR